jgi:hypothetical protein
MPPELGPYLDGLLGRPWEADGLHCWALARQVVRDLFGVEVPPVLVSPKGRRARADLFNNHPARAGWAETANLGSWALALMHRRGAPPALVEHCGVYLPIEGGCVLHTDSPHGVVLDSLFVLPRVRTWAAPTLFAPRS